MMGTKLTQQLWDQHVESPHESIGDWVKHDYSGSKISALERCVRDISIWENSGMHERA